MASPPGLRSLRQPAFALSTWTNLDGVAHTVTFNDGACFFTIAAGERKWCEGPGSGFLTYAGTYRYLVSDLIEPAARPLLCRTNAASRWSPREQPLASVRPWSFMEPLSQSTSASVFPTADDHDASSPSGVTGRFLVIRRVRSTSPQGPCCCDPDDVWSTTIRPRGTSTYVARIADPPEKTVWMRAESQRILVRVTSPLTR